MQLLEKGGTDQQAAKAQVSTISFQFIGNKSICTIGMHAMRMLQIRQG